MILRPPPEWAGRNEEIRLDSSSAPLKVGRGQFGITSRTVSREHFELEWCETLNSDDAAVRIRHLADNPMRVCTGAGNLTVLRAGDQCTLRPGDTIFIDGRVSGKVAADASNHTHALQLCADANSASEAGASRDDSDWQDWEDSDDDDDEEDEDESLDDDTDAGHNGDDDGTNSNGVDSDCTRRLSDNRTTSDPSCASAVTTDAESVDITDRRSAVPVKASAPAAPGSDSATTPVPAAAYESADMRRASAAVTPVRAPAVPMDYSDNPASEPDVGTASSQLSTGQLLDGLSMEELAALEVAAAQRQEHFQPTGCSVPHLSGARVAEAGVEDANPQPKKPLQGLRFAVTGALEVLTRDECQVMVEKHGGVFQAGGLRKTNRSASGRTTHLIIGTQMEDGRPVETSSKFQQARRCGMRIIKEDDLFAMVAGRNVPLRHKRSPSARNRRSSCSTSGIDRSHSPSEASSDCSPSAPLLQAAAVRAAGGYPLSLFPESEVGTVKRRKLEMLARHLVVLTDDVLHKVGVPPPVLPVVDEIESSDDDEYKAIAQEDESCRLSTSDRRVSFRSGGAGVETVAEVTSPNCEGAAASSTGGSNDSVRCRRLAAVVSPVGHQRALSASAALRQTDFVLARDVLRLDGHSSDKDRPVPPGQLSLAHACNGGGSNATSVRDNENGGYESSAMEFGDAGNPGHDDGQIPPTSPHQVQTVSPLAHVARSSARVHDTLQPSSQPARLARQPMMSLASPTNGNACDRAISSSPKLRPSMGDFDHPEAPRGTADSLAESAEDTTTSKSPLVPESPLLSWNPDAAAVEFGALRSVTSRSAQNHTRAVLTEDQVLVPETQATQRREQDLLFVPETQMRTSDSASASAHVSPLALRTARLRDSRITDTHPKVLVPETQQPITSGGGGGANGGEDTSTGRVVGWLSQSVEAAVVMANRADQIASPMVDDRAGETPEPTLYTASVAVQSVGGMDPGAVEHIEDSSDQDQSPHLDDSSFRTFPGDASPAPKQVDRMSQERITKVRGRARRGFESGSSSDDEEADEDGQCCDALQMRRAELHARTRSNPFSASAVLSMNPTQPELSGLLRANAAPMPRRKRHRGASPMARARVSGRHRPTFSWTNKTRPQLPDRLSQQSEAVCAKQLGQKKRAQSKQQRLTAWVAR